MEETGKVLEVAGAKVKVGIHRRSQCAECEVKDCCLELTPGEMVLEADNAVGAKEGELVKVYLQSEKAFAAGGIVYVFPIVSFFVGFAIGTLIADILGLTATEVVGIIAAFVFLVLSYFVINRFYGEGKRGARQFQPVVKEVIKAG
jgi:positive regulator of sigma E activity